MSRPQTASNPPAIAAPPDAIRTTFKLSPFYRKCIVADGLPVLSSEKVSDDALREAVFLVNQMLTGRDDVRRALVKNRVRVAIMAPTELTTDIPEHSDLTPKDYWDKRARGLGATFSRPAISGAQENLLREKGDRYPTESIFVHEFAHAIHEMGINSLDPAFDKRLRDTFDAAIRAGLWKGTYAATNHKEYWAEGVQSYFDTNAANNPSHNDIDTREKLARYDPALFALIDKAFRGNPWRYTRPDRRQPVRR